MIRSFVNSLLPKMFSLSIGIYVVSCQDENIKLLEIKPSELGSRIQDTWRLKLITDLGKALVSRTGTEG